MRRNQSRFSNMPAELLTAKLSSFARFSGATTRRMKPPGNERKIFSKTTLTYFLANPNLEGEIHLKGGRFVTSQIFKLECYTLDHHAYHIFLHFRSILEISRNSRTLGESWRFRYFHTLIFSNFEKRIIWFWLFSLPNISKIKIYERR